MSMECQAGLTNVVKAELTGTGAAYSPALRTRAGAIIQAPVVWHRKSAEAGVMYNKW